MLRYALGAALALHISPAFAASGHDMTATGDHALTWNLYSHAEAYFNDKHSKDGKEDYALLGETTLFLGGSLGERTSLLYEGTYQPKRYRDDVFKSERWQLRYELPNNHYVMFGKGHTPVNYWNDSFHHGRVFYPGISRPLSLDKFIPLHDSALRVGGRALGDKGFFYDIALGAGHRYEDKVFPKGILSETVSLGWQTLAGNVLRFGWHRNSAHQVGHGITTTAVMVPAHGMDAGMNMMGDAHAHGVTLDVLEVFTASLKWQLGRTEWLTELASSDGSRETEHNLALYQYVGYQLTDSIVPYAVLDWLELDRGLGLRAGVESRSGVGVKFYVRDNVDLKLEMLRHRDGTKAGTPGGVEFRAQVSVSLK